MPWPSPAATRKLPNLMRRAKHDALPIALVKDRELPQHKSDASVSDVQRSANQLLRSLLNVRLAALDLDGEMGGTQSSGSAHRAAILA